MGVRPLSTSAGIRWSRVRTLARTVTAVALVALASATAAPQPAQAAGPYGNALN